MAFQRGVQILFQINLTKHIWCQVRFWSNIKLKKYIYLNFYYIIYLYCTGKSLLIPTAKGTVRESNNLAL